MKVSVVSDVHGNFADLARVAEQAELLMILGDLLDYVDYHQPENGILGTIFGGPAVERLIAMRIAGDFEAYHAWDRQLWSTLADPVATLESVIAQQYAEAVAALGDNTLVMLGNVDVEHVWRAVAPDHLQPVDATVVTIDGARFGFVGGGAVRVVATGSPWRSFDRPSDTYRSVVGALDELDVLCTHLPPKLADMRFDLVAGREEMYGPGILEFIEARQPALALSGHIHHPRSAEQVVGATRCVNVGHFQREPRPFILDTDDLRPG